jgi:chromosome segregation ATPase
LPLSGRVSATRGASLQEDTASALGPRAVAQASNGGWMQTGRRDTLTAKAMRAVAAEKRVAELEAELSAAREELAHRDNKILSLEKSLDLNVDESTRLAGQLTERSTALENAHQQLEQMRLALNALHAQRHKASGKWQEETSALNGRLETALARAEKAEKMLANAQNDLLSLSLENSAALRRIHNLKGSLRETTSEIEEQKSKLVDEIKTRDAALRRAEEEARAQSKLADEIKARDAALKRADERIRLLAELFMQLEAKAHLAGAQEIIEIGSPLAYTRAGAGNGGGNCAVLERDLDNDAWLFGGRKSARLS